MWRALALALGVTIGILGAESLLIDKVVLAGPRISQEGGVLSSSPSRTREITPPEWAPWTLLSAGAVIILYSFTIPRRVAT